jgi:phosphoglycolate phosphatase
VSRNFDLLVFDWDGTLVDSAELIARCIQAAGADLGLPVPSAADARHVIGLGLADALLHVFPHLPPRDYPRVVERYRAHFLQQDAAIGVFAGVPEMLAACSQAGGLLAVATGKSRAGLRRALASTGLEDRFDATRCADEGFPKPHPDMLHHLMATLGVDPRRTLMIGDTTHDLDMAANAGVAAIAVSYGAHTGDELRARQALACCASVHELHTWLAQHG